MRHVILVSMDWHRPQDGKTSLGIASIAAALTSYNIPVTLIEETINTPDFRIDEVLNRTLDAIRDAGPDCLVGFGVYVWNDSEVCYLINKVRVMSRVKIVLGGPQISYMPKGGLELAYPQADIFVRGQGEMAMVHLSRNEIVQGQGIHVAGAKDLGIKADYDLTSLASPYLEGAIAITSNVRWETQRGCPFKCSFCQHREPGNRLKNQKLSQSRLSEELELFSQSNVRRISVLDPIFHANSEHAVRLLEIMKRYRLDAQVSLQGRFEMVTPDFLDALEGLDITLEFGLQTIIPEECKAIGRPNNLRKIEEVISELHRRQIDFEVSLIYGLPHQTLTSFRQSVEWCHLRGIPRLRAWPLMLLRGTPLYDQKRQYGFKESTDLSIPVVTASHSFTESDYHLMMQLAAEQEKF